MVALQGYDADRRYELKVVPVLMNRELGKQALRAVPPWRHEHRRAHIRRRPASCWGGWNGRVADKVPNSSAGFRTPQLNR
jgi:hypothetical protein